jgi:hypothetical protein
MVAQKDLSAPPGSNEEPLVLTDENRGFFISVSLIRHLPDSCYLLFHDPFIGISI